MESFKTFPAYYSYILCSDSTSAKSGTDKSKAPARDTRPQTEVHGTMLF